MNIHFDANFIDIACVEDEFKDIRRVSQIKQARHLPVEAALLLPQCRKIMEGTPIDPEKLGVVCADIPCHIDFSYNFLTQWQQRGSDLVNPISFPSTISSSLPNVLARYLSANAFSLSVGSGVFAYAEALDRTKVLLSSGRAEYVFLLSAFVPHGIAKPVNTVLQRDTTKIFSSVMLATNRSLSRPHLRLLDELDNTDSKNYAFSGQDSHRVTSEDKGDQLDHQSLSSAVYSKILFECAADAKDSGFSSFSTSLTYKNDSCRHQFSWSK